MLLMKLILMHLMPYQKQQIQSNLIYQTLKQYLLIHGILEESIFVDDTHIEKGKAIIGVDTPYARRVYFHPEYNFKKNKNPNAQGMWFETYISGDKKNYANELFKKFMKGKI